MYIRRIKYDETCKMSVKSSKQLIRPNYFSSQFHTNIPRQQTQQTTHSADLNITSIQLCNKWIVLFICHSIIIIIVFRFFIFGWLNCVGSRVSCYVVCFFDISILLMHFIHCIQFQFQFYRLHHFECRI